MTNETTGTLRNARRVPAGMDVRAPCLKGEIYGDIKGRFPDGSPITTSTILGEDGDIFRTRYSVYKVESWADEPLMVPGMGALPIAANDNGLAALAARVAGPLSARIAGLRITNEGRRSIIYGDGRELAAETFAPLESLHERRGEFMQTYTGRKFWPLDPRADEVNIGDIAHSLSLQCRYAGHCYKFYSVAEHSVLIARWLWAHYGAEAALCGLLHDAAEAYLVDVPRPVKPYLTGYRDAEAKVMAAVSERFGLPEMPACVKEADDRIIADELVNLRRMDWHAKHDNPLGVPLKYWAPARAESEFLITFRMLTEAAEVRAA